MANKSIKRMFLGFALMMFGGLFITSSKGNLGGFEFVIMTTGIWIMVVGYYTKD